MHFTLTERNNSLGLLWYLAESKSFTCISQSYFVITYKNDLLQWVFLLSTAVFEVPKLSGFTKLLPSFIVCG